MLNDTVLVDENSGLFNERRFGSVRDIRHEIQNRVVSPWRVPLLGWHAGRPAGPSGAKKRASRRTDRRRRKKQQRENQQQQLLLLRQSDADVDA